jgi:hypothetical protein
LAFGQSLAEKAIFSSLKKSKISIFIPIFKFFSSNFHIFGGGFKITWLLIHSQACAIKHFASVSFALE